jgi:signal transduction histidine kinase
VTVTSPSERRVRDTATAVRRVRWVGAGLAAVQFAAFQPPRELGAMPFSRLGVGAAVVVALVGLNLVSARVARTGDVDRIRRFGFVELVADTTIVALVMVLFGFDPTSRIWPVLTFPVIEGAMRGALRGALLTWAYGAGVYVVEQLVRLPARDDPAAWVGSIPFGAGILLLVALGTGTLASRVIAAEAELAADRGRLRRLAVVGRTMHAARDPHTVHQHVVDASRELLGVRYASLYEYLGGEAWRLVAQHGLEVTADGETEHLPALTQLTRGMAGPTVIDRGAVAGHVAGLCPDAVASVASPILADEQVRGLLIVSRDVEGPSLQGDDLDLLELLAAHAATAMRNADLVAAEGRTIAELRRLDHAKDEFLSILTHELRTPMATMAGSAELLRERWDAIPATRRDEFLDAINRNTRRLATLIQDVFDALQAERTELPVTLAPTDLLPLLVDAAHQEVAGSDRHRLAFDVDHATPPALADPDRVSQIAHNLLSNAVKYSPEGGTITIGLASRGDGVVFRIADEGIGIPAAARRQLFGKFQRLHATDRRMRGTGLGLYLAKTLVDAMGGGIDVTSVEGEGTVFEVQLPVAPAGDRASPV